MMIQIVQDYPIIHNETKWVTDQTTQIEYKT